MFFITFFGFGSVRMLKVNRSPLLKHFALLPRLVYLLLCPISSLAYGSQTPNYKSTEGRTE
jgi:hypothetical protein